MFGVTPSSAEEHFGDIYARNYRHVLAYCGRRLPSSEALDAASDTFLVVWRRLGDVPDEPSERPWLYGVARRVVANHHRSARRRHHLIERIASDGQAVIEAPDDQVLRTEPDRRVIDALNLLGEADREVVLLRLWEELSTTEIAECLGISDVAVRKRLSRARRRLKRLLSTALQPQGVAHD
ncbi:MAG: sigma-70 family RNA polymerase sigma factor [Acidimicrobiia bacterium]|nr:sigma-70 family RNA polymerase sigma factor [Acidimicrobiia bacterium]